MWWVYRCFVFVVRSSLPDLIRNQNYFKNINVYEIYLMLFLSQCEHSTEPWFSLCGPDISKSISLDLIVSTDTQFNIKMQEIVQ